MKTNFFTCKTAKVMLSLASFLIVISSSMLSSCGGDSSEDGKWDKYKEIIENVVDSDKTNINPPSVNYQLDNLEIEEYDSREASEIDLSVLRKWLKGKDMSNISVRNIKECSDSTEESVLFEGYTDEDGREVAVVYAYMNSTRVAFATDFASKADFNDILEKMGTGDGTATQEDKIYLGLFACVAYDQLQEYIMCSDLHTKDGKVYRLVALYGYNGEK